MQKEKFYYYKLKFFNGVSINTLPHSRENEEIIRGWNEFIKQNIKKKELLKFFGKEAKNLGLKLRIEQDKVDLDKVNLCQRKLKKIKQAPKTKKEKECFIEDLNSNQLCFLEAALKTCKEWSKELADINEQVFTSNLVLVETKEVSIADRKRILNCLFKHLVQNKVFNRKFGLARKMGSKNSEKKRFRVDQRFSVDSKALTGFSLLTKRSRNETALNQSKSNKKKICIKPVKISTKHEMDWIKTSIVKTTKNPFQTIFRYFQM